MDLNEHIQNNRIKIKVIPSAKKNELIEKENRLFLYLKAVPEKGKANKEIISFFKKKFKLNVRIVKGIKSREKTLRII